MFYRRKIILALLQTSGGNLPKISLQKLLFLFTNRQSKPNYNFVPYHYGCYSFSANADLTALIKNGLITEDKSSFTKIDNVDYVTSLREDDKKVLIDIKDAYGEFSTTSLMKFIYLYFQYFAINSLKARDMLTYEQYEKVLAAKPTNNKTTLYTIGYEGISLEEYLNRLIINDIKVLVDVRNNPLSMKFGFSKTKLKTFCASLNIEYLHMPEVGIQSKQRKELNSQCDYDKLFDTYKNLNLKRTTSHQEQILMLLQQKKRIALTCFEANICQCHRKHLAEAITKLSKWSFEVKHI